VIAGTRKRSTRKPVTYSGLMIVEKPMLGPEAGHNTRCLKCHKLITEGEHWRKVWAADGSYAVAVHDGCYLQGPAGARG
jgi:hypothetical protein